MMSRELPFIKIPAKKGEKVRKLLQEVELLAKDYKIMAEGVTLLIPLQPDTKIEKIRELLEEDSIEMGTRLFESAIEGPRTLAEALEGVLSPKELGFLPRAYDLIGDIAVLEIPEEIEAHSIHIGNAFQSVHSNFSTVLAKRGAITGATRVREYRLLAGVDKTRTVHTEYGCKIAVDLANAYFSPRLLEEHNRVSDQVDMGEVVVDMFTGVGPFALHIARKQDARVVAIDINPLAIDLLHESMAMNKLVGTIEPVVADAHKHVPANFDHDVDRVIMNHPSGAFEFIVDACQSLRRGGIMHYYDFGAGENPEDEIVSKVSRLVRAAGKGTPEVLHVRRVRDSAPYEYQMVVDLVIS